jgi:hypothetical protein
MNPGDVTKIEERVKTAMNKAESYPLFKSRYTQAELLAVTKHVKEAGFGGLKTAYKAVRREKS